MMSYTDEVGSMSTLAHELGHSMHSYLTWKNQPLVYIGLFVVRRGGGIQFQSSHDARTFAQDRQR